MTGGTNQGLFIILAVIVFGIFIVMVRVIIPQQGKTMEAFKDGAEQVTNGKEKVPSRALGN